MDKLLYCPYINLPETNWTVRVLLYYDEVGSIVPQQYFYAPEEYNPYMRNLIQEGLVNPINPIEVLDNWDRINTPFLDYMKTAEFDLSRRIKTFDRGDTHRIHRDKFMKSGWNIHSDKFGGAILYELQHAGLAINNRNGWYTVERKTANELMTYLTTIVAHKIKYMPTSDELTADFTFKSQNQQVVSQINKYNFKRQILLTKIIPFPQEIDINKLRRFKDKHADLLKRFRNKAELIVLDDRFEIGSQLFEEKVNEILYDKEELSARMKDSSVGKIIFGGVYGIMKGFVGMAVAENPLGLVLGIPEFTKSIKKAIHYEQAEDAIDPTGVKYLALIDKRIRRRPNRLLLV